MMIILGLRSLLVLMVERLIDISIFDFVDFQFFSPGIYRNGMQFAMK